MTTTLSGDRISELTAIRDDIMEQWLQTEIEMRLARERHDLASQQRTAAAEDIARIEKAQRQILEAGKRAANDVNEYRIERELARRQQEQTS